MFLRKWKKVLRVITRNVITTGNPFLHGWSSDIRFFTKIVHCYTQVLYTFWNFVRSGSTPNLLLYCYCFFWFHYQSRYNPIPLVGLRCIRTNQFNHTFLSMSNRTRSISTMSSLSMANGTRSICAMLHYQWQTGHDLSAQFPIYV